MKDKIREIEEIVINNKMSAQQKIRAIYQATRLDEEKVANAIHKSDHPEYKDCVDCKNARYFAKAICLKQDELTKEVRDGKKNY